MRSDTFIFMRASPVDLLRYLPRFLARDKTFKDIQDTLSREHENLRLKLIDVAKQFFVETATWGLKDWEDFLAITPAKDSDLELRRANVAAKLLGQSTMTIENTNNLINQYTSQGLSYIVETTGQPNVVRIEIHDVFVYFHEMRKMLWEMLPAHLWDKYLFRVEDLADDEGKNISDEFFAKVIAEYHDQYPYANWERAAKYDGEFLHIGEIRRENYVVEIDELHLQTGFKFYDDYSLGYIRRGGYSIFHNSFNRHNNKFRYNAKKSRGGLTFHESKIFYNGIFTYGLNVLPADFLDTKIQKTFSEEIEKPVESGSLEIKIALSRRGNFHYDGTHYRGESLNFADDLSGSRSLKNICRNGEFKIEVRRNGKIIDELADHNLVVDCGRCRLAELAAGFSTNSITQNSADLGDLAEKDEVAKTDLTTALKNEIEGKADAGTSLADYGITDAYTKTEIDAKFSSVYKAGGNVTFANLPVATDTTLGMVYNVTDAFTTTADFNEGAGKDYLANTNVAIVTPDNGATFKYDIFMGAIDLSNYAQLEDVETSSAADITAICNEYYGS